MGSCHQLLHSNRPKLKSVLSLWPPVQHAQSKHCASVHVGCKQDLSVFDDLYLGCRKHKHGRKRLGRVMYPTSLLPILVRLVVGIWVSSAV